MDWRQSLEIVVARTGVERYRVLCSDDSPHPAEVGKYRDLMVSMATGRPAYPPAATMAASAIRAAAGFVASGGAVVDAAERDRRLAICRECPEFVPDQGRCRKCGCYANLKARIARSVCPDSPPRW